MNQKSALLCLFALSALLCAPIHACTLWGVAGERSLDGTLIAKNRDWFPNHQQSLRLYTPRTGYRYLGLFADDGRYKGIKAGVNEPGLVVLSASASSIARSVRESDRERHGVMAQILQHSASLDDVNDQAQALFSQAKPVFLLLADKTGLMLVEVGLRGQYRLKRLQQGVVAHTNHYSDDDLLDQPQQVGVSSATRLARIESLLAARHAPWQLGDFARISRDQNAGPENSLWRFGKEHTLASWQMAVPKQGPVRVHLILANPDQAEQLVDVTLDSQFWQQRDGVLAPK